MKEMDVAGKLLDVSKCKDAKEAITAIKNAPKTAEILMAEIQHGELEMYCDTIRNDAKNISRIELVKNHGYGTIDGMICSRGLISSPCGVKLLFCPPGRTGTIRIPEGVREIGDYCFKGTRISGVELPKSLERIGTGAFPPGTIKSVVLPPSVKHVGRMNFQLAKYIKVEGGKPIEGLINACARPVDAGVVTGKRPPCTVIEVDGHKFAVPIAPDAYLLSKFAVDWDRGGFSWMEADRLFEHTSYKEAYQDTALMDWDINPANGAALHAVMANAKEMAVRYMENGDTDSLIKLVDADALDDTGMQELLMMANKNGSLEARAYILKKIEQMRIWPEECEMEL